MANALPLVTTKQQWTLQTSFGLDTQLLVQIVLLEVVETSEEMLQFKNSSN